MRLRTRQRPERRRFGRRLHRWPEPFGRRACTRVPHRVRVPIGESRVRAWLRRRVHVPKSCSDVGSSTPRCVRAWFLVVGSGPRTPPVEGGRSRVPSSRGRKALSYLVDPASSHMLVSKTKPCMSKYKPLHGETANGSLNQLWFLRS